MGQKSSDYDVAIVGYGPVGQSLATLLGRQGWSVLALDKQSGLYPMPRACHLDHEAMRILQAMNIAEDVHAAMVPAREYLLLRPDMSVLSDLPRGWETPSGWEASYHFFQPDIESIFDKTAKSTPGVTVRQSTAVTKVTDTGEQVELSLDGQDDLLTARFVIGADGANSLVRKQSSIAREDLGFEATWVVVDVLMNPGEEPPEVPDTGQVLDPQQPSHMAWLGGDHYRWEFMIVDGSDPVAAAREENIWSRIGRWVSPGSATLLRSTAYTFRSLLAESFNRGRVLLAGDAAHLMPPFMGQGMVSGLRDAITLSWMLDLVLRGTASVEFLDGYTESRKSHVNAYITESVRVGQLVCETDPAKAAERDRILEAQTEPNPPFQPLLGGGYEPGPLGGQLAVQPRIQNESGGTLLDDVLGTGFCLLTIDPAEVAELQPTAQSRLSELGVETVAILNDESTTESTKVHCLIEQGERFGRWMLAARAAWVLVRPDGYVYDSGTGQHALEQSVEKLHAKVTGQARVPA